MESKEVVYGTETRLIHGEMNNTHWEYSHHVVPPISASTAFCLDSTTRGAEGFIQFGSEQPKENQPIYIYERLAEPNKDLLEENMAIAEKGECAVAFASGMAAISGALGAILKAGDHVVKHTVVYGCTHSLFHNWFPRLGWEYSEIDLTHPELLAAAVTPKTRVVYFETPVNPTMQLIDIRAVADIVKELNKSRTEENRIWVICDNTFATCFCQRPLELGADIIASSLTKGVSGFGTDMGGIVVAPKKLRTSLLMWRKDFGGVMSPKAAWSILNYGLSSLPVRMRQMVQNARDIVAFLSSHPNVQSVSYPGLESFPQYELARRQMLDFDGNFMPGSMIFMELKGDTPKDRQANAARFINHLAKHSLTVTLAVSLGHVRTLVEHPSTMTHAPIPPEEQEKAGLSVGGIRFSVGLENIRDLLRDVSAALDYAFEPNQN